MKSLFASILLVVFSMPLAAAEITLRNDLLGRLENLRLVYPSTNVFEEFGAPARNRSSNNTYWDNVRVFEISGEIVEGDADRLRDAIGPDDFSRPFFIVFDSPGGNFLEGVRIGALLREYAVGNGVPRIRGALVLNGSECMSACAVAFTMTNRGGFNAVGRFVEQGGRLGFHMPSVQVDHQSTQTEIAAAMDLTYDIMTEFVELVANGNAPPALIQNALHYRRADEFFVLQGGLITNFMNFQPVVGPEGGTPLSLDGLTLRDAFAMCQALAFTRAQDWSAGNYEFWSVELTRSLPDDTPLATVFQQLGGNRLETNGCMIERQDNNTLGIAGEGTCDSADWCVVPQGQFPPPALHTANGALLADTLGCPGGRMTREFYVWDWSNRFLEEETPEFYRWEGTTDPNAPRQTLDWSGATLEIDLTIPGAKANDPATVWAAGTEVTVTDCSLTADGHGVWYEVTKDDGVGWVSARYVEVPDVAALSELPYLRALIRPVGFE